MKNKRKFLFNTALALVVAALNLFNAAKAKEELIIKDLMSDCGSGSNHIIIYDKQGDILKARTINKEISLAQFKQLITEIIESKKYPKLDLASLNFTSEAVKSHLSDILKAAAYIKPISEQSIKSNPELFEFSNLSKQFTEWVKWGRPGTRHVRFSVIINDKSLYPDPIEVKSYSNLFGMLPWRIKAGNSEWKSYSILLTHKLVNFDVPEAYSYKHLNCSSYWQNDFWHDNFFWGHRIGDKLYEYEARSKIESLPGFTEAKKIFSIDSCFEGSSLDNRDLLRVRLTSKSPAAIHTINWDILLDSSKKPISGWYKLLELYQRSSVLINKQKWLIEWLKASSDRSISLNILGDKLYDDAEDLMAVELLPLWQQLKIPGKPYANLLFYKNNEYCGEVWLSDKDNSPALLLSNKTDETHSNLFSNQSISYDLEKPICLLVSPGGKYTKHRLSQSYLAKWRAYVNKVLQNSSANN